MPPIKKGQSLDSFHSQKAQAFLSRLALWQRQMWKSKTETGSLKTSINSVREVSDLRSSPFSEWIGYRSWTSSVKSILINRESASLLFPWEDQSLSYDLFSPLIRELVLAFNDYSFFVRCSSVPKRWSLPIMSLSIRVPLRGDHHYSFQARR